MALREVDKFSWGGNSVKLFGPFLKRGLLKGKRGACSFLFRVDFFLEQV